MSRIFILAVAVLIFSCGEVAPSEVSQKSYVNLDSILDAQENELLKRGFIIQKSVLIDELRETKEVQMDSMTLREELMAFRDLDLNVPSFVGAFETIKIENSIRYERKPEERTSIAFVQFDFTDSGELRRITGNFRDDRAQLIYNVTRSYELNFEGNELKSYQIAGFQKMVMKDTTWFSVEGVIEIKK